MVNSKYVVLEEKDFEAASAVKTKVIEISDFVLQEEINSIYYETPYYIAPEKSGVRALVVLTILGLQGHMPSDFFQLPVLHQATLIILS